MANDWVSFHLNHVEETDKDAIDVCRIIQGRETCNFGFLQRKYVPHFACYASKVAKLREVWTSNDESAMQRHTVHKAGIMGREKVDGVNDTSYDDSSDADLSDLCLIE